MNIKRLELFLESPRPPRCASEAPSATLLPMVQVYGSVIRMAESLTDFGWNVFGATYACPPEAVLEDALDEQKLKK